MADLATAVAQALRAAGLVSTDRIELVRGADGSCALGLAGDSPDDTRCFADALLEVLGPLEDPAYVVSRRVVARPTSLGAALRLGLRRRLRIPRRAELVWHAVPSVLSGRAEDAETFLQAWQRHVGAARVLPTAQREGAAAVAAQGSGDPTGAASVMRTRWR